MEVMYAACKRARDCQKPENVHDYPCDESDPEECNLKITAVKPYTVHPGWRKNLILVKVETDAGIHGWG
jgi:hypothetical protein